MHERWLTPLCVDCARALINSLVCWLCTSAVGLVLFQLVSAGKWFKHVGAVSLLWDHTAHWQTASLSGRGYLSHGDTSVPPPPPPPPRTPTTHTHSPVCDHVTLLFVVVIIVVVVAMMLVVMTFRAEGPLASPVTAALFSRTCVPLSV